MATPKNSSVQKAFDILTCFTPRNSEMSASEVAAATGMNLATVHRFLLTLEDLGALARAGRHRFQLGMLLAELGDSVEHHKLLVDVARPHVAALVERYHESVRVALRNGNQVMYVAAQNPVRSLQIHAPAGRTVPLHASACGKVLLAGLPHQERSTLLSGMQLTRYTARTTIDPARLREELELVEANGFAIDDEEMEEGLRCIAVPIRQPDGKVIASLSLSAPATRLDWQRRDEYVAALSEHAQQISSGLYVDSRVLADKAAPRGPYPHVKRVGDFVFVSGTSSRRPDQSFEGARLQADGHVTLDIRQQTRATLSNIADYLHSVGAELSDVVDLTAYLTDMSDYERFNAVYSEFFDQGKGPTRTTVGVPALPHPHQLLMIKAMAYKPL